MVLVDYRLLYTAAVLIHGVENVAADLHWGNFGRRIPLSNQTTSAAVVSSATYGAGLSSASTSVEVPGSSTVSLKTAQVLSSVTTSANVNTQSSLSQQSASAEDLGTTTTAGSLSTFVVVSSGISSLSTSIISAPDLGSLLSIAPPSVTTVASLLSTYGNTFGATRSSAPAFITSALTGTDRNSDWNASTYATGTISAATLITDTKLTTNILEDPCSVTTNTDTVTVWSTIYTSTITWTGDPADYTPPYPSTSTPVVCTVATGRLSASVCDGSRETCTVPFYPGSSGYRGIPPPALTTAPPTSAYTSSTGDRKGIPTITFWTTDKNPVVVYSSANTPEYGDEGTTIVVDHHTAVGDVETAITTPEYGKVTTTAVTTPAAPKTSTPYYANQTPTTGPGGGSQTPTAVTVVIQTTQVIINGATFTDNTKSKTSTVVVGTDTFVINPSEVVGAGATVVRPATGGIFVPTTATTTIGGLEVVYGSSVATIAGTVFTIGSAPSTAVVEGQVITLGPAGIAFPSQTIPIVRESSATEAAVLGGQLVTAIGNSIAVVDGTTFTYGPDLSTTTKVVDSDTILVGPSGVIVRGLTLGGRTAASTATTYEIAGGATITEVGGSVIVIGSSTFSIGSGASMTTTIIGGETLTIGPNGVAISSQTFAQPYATSTVIEPGETPAVATATETAKNMGPVLRPHWVSILMGISIAIGAGLLGLLLY